MANTSKAFDSQLIKIHRLLLLGSVAATAIAASAFLSAGSALAQDGNGDAMSASGDEIIVSARRRDESLQDVPISVTAVSGEVLTQFGVQDITYLTQSIPNTTLKVSRGTNSTLTAFIRGVGQQDPVAGFESGVGIYIDDVYLNRPQGAVLDIYDVERVEVLRGPQGTLYGRNTVGGALKYVTKRLGDDPSLKLRGSAGTYGQFDIVGTGELPLSDVFAVGGTVAYFTRNGYGENLTTGDDNYDKDVLAFRASAEFDNDVVFARLSGDYLKDKSNPKGGHRLIPGLFSGAPVLDNVFDSRGGLTGKNEAEAYGATLHVEISLNDQWTLKNIAAWREDESFQLIDFDALPAADIDVPAVYRNEQFTEELQILYESDAVAGVAGFYYIDASAYQNADIVLDLSGSLIPAPFGPLPGLNANLFGDVDTKSWSVFGDLTFNLENILGLQGVELSVGGRYTSDKRSARIVKQQFLGNTPPFGMNPILLLATSDFTGEAKFTDFSPKASLSWSPNSEHNFYVSYSQGFKGGGFDPRGDSTVVTADFDGDGDVDADDVFEFFLFDPEEVDSYEAGWKASLAGGRITSNLAVFYAEYTNVQIPGSQAAIDPFTMSPTFFGITTNAGAAEFIGVEWEGRALVGEDIFGAGDAFTLSWGGGWIDADYTEFVTGAPPVDVSDQRVVQNTPEFSGAITTNYSHPMGLAGREGDIALITQLSYKSRTHIFEIPNPLLDQGGYGLFDASLVWTSDDGNLQIGVHGKNLLDREYRIAGYNFLAQNPDGTIVAPLTPLLGLEGTETAFYGPPRTITGTIEVQFQSCGASRRRANVAPPQGFRCGKLQAVRLFRRKRIMAEPQTRCFDARRPLFPEILALHEKWRGDQAAVICDGNILSWRAFGAASNRVANALIASGLKSGDTVVVAMENGIETVETLFGVMKAGCVSAPLNLTVSDDALAMMIADSQAKAVIVSENQRARFSGLIREHGGLQMVAFGESDQPWTGYDEWKSAQSASSPCVDIAPDALLNIIYSSGTTGRPKGIAHTHLSRLDWAYDLSVALRYHGGARTLCTLALYSNISWVMMLCTFLAGGTLIITPKFDPGDFIEKTAGYRATHTALVPVQLRRIVDHPDFSADKVRSMSAMMSCGSPLHAELKQRIFDTFPAGVIELFGLTEGVATTLDPEDAEGRMASVGKPLLGTDIRIIGDDDRPVPAREAGEIVGTGRIVMPFYFNRPDETEMAVWRDEEGRAWLRTGDVGRLDEDGFLYIVDRKKDLILSGGQNIYPSDIEAVLLERHDVTAAAVIAAPHEEWGETPFAVVEAREGASEEELAEWANERLGRRQRITGLTIIEALPRNPNGKILKRELRANLFPERTL